MSQLYYDRIEIFEIMLDSNFNLFNYDFCNFASVTRHKL